MADYPRSLRDFQKRFPDDAACAEHLARTRWAEGFICPRCGGRDALPGITLSLLQPQDLGARRLSRPAAHALQSLPRRVRVPIHPPSHPARQLRFASLRCCASP